MMEPENDNGKLDAELASLCAEGLGVIIPLIEKAGFSEETRLKAIELAFSMIKDLSSR